MGVAINPSEFLVAPDDVPYYLQLLESPDREQWLKAEAVLIPFAQGRAVPDANQHRLLVDFDKACVHNKHLVDAGALPTYTQHLLRAMTSLKGLNFQYMELEMVERLLGQLNRAITMLYLVVTLSPHASRPAMQRSLVDVGLFPPHQLLVDIFDCLQVHHAIPGFPIKRLMLLVYVWITTILGDLNELDRLKAARRQHHHLGTNSDSLKKPATVPLGDPATDPLYPTRVKTQAARDAIHAKYLHRPHADLSPVPPASVDAFSSDDVAPLSDDQAWGARVELLYKLVLVPKWKEYTGLLGAIITTMAAGNAMDKRGYFSKRKFSVDDTATGVGSSSSGSSNPDEQLYWNWMNREKAIVLDVTSLVILHLLKHVRSSHYFKGELLAQGLVEGADTATYVQVRAEDASHQRVEMHPPMQKAVAVLADDPSMEYALAPLRTVTSLLRIVQRLTKRKPSLIRAMLCRTQSLVWLKRVLNLRDPTSRLYALKLVKSQGRYLGHQWMRKFTCVHLLTEVYLHVRPELEDDWLKSDEDEASPLAKASEALLQGEVHAFHHKWYWSKPQPPAAPSSGGVSIAVQGLLDLQHDTLDVDGGSARKLVADLKLDTALCGQYEKWLDARGITSSSTTTSTFADDVVAPWPIAFH
ncbi:hypothetical protein DYB25_002438 [Aphanomyces astaci]|uniref:Far11/STRP C-terminal domain-containing protein n=2 Tax=Aphanomyces astaci TaxID=112090 RepID=A0A397E2B0_APHAT|nr:hypothetical protein DYB25_002438 [Aphanomyces astaci]RHY75033.1 hypothetical protein DYB30_001616 [Aphanomyces astaci]RHZ11656.1 hypothetical protein DYB31_002630 [Aphanomyces astaci]